MKYAFSPFLTLFSAFMLVGTVAAPESNVWPVDLRCEYRVNPVGIDARNPRLSWRLEATYDTLRGLGQTAYQVRVASSPDGGADLWDSGKVAGGDTVHLVYGGVPLKSRARCFWQVRVWDAEDRPSEWSGTAFWSMGLLEPADWRALWIGRDETEERAARTMEGRWIWYPEPAADPRHAAPPATRWFRRTVSVPEGRVLRRALLSMAADNLATAWVDGEEVLRSASFHTAAKRDVTTMLRPGGRHSIAVAVDNVGETPNPAGLMLTLQMEFEDGTVETLLTDVKWRTSDTIFDGWQAPDFDDSGWAFAMDLGENGTAPWGGVLQGEDRRLPARYLRTEFTLDKAVARATAYVCGLGYHEFYVNGRKAGDAVLAPALTDYRKRALYTTHDVTALLRDGENAVGAILGNGHFFAPRLRDPFPTVNFGYPRLIAQIELEFEDGSTGHVLSDGSWKLTANGPIRNNNVYDGEEYDARLELGAWTEPGYDDAAWEAASPVAPIEGALESHDIEPIRMTRSVKPSARTNPEPGVYIFDMGQNMVGWVRYTVEAPADTVITLRHAEVLDADGNLDLRNMRNAAVTTSYTCRGGGPEAYAPRFTYHGFRYVEVRGWPGEPPLDVFTGEVLHTDVEPAGDFACSNPLLNRIHANIQWGVRGNLRSIPTDCPQRDERHGWLGDIANESRAQSYEFLMANFYAKWLDDIRLAQKDTGSIPDIAPPFWEMYNDNVTWPNTYLIIPGWYYQIYGDRQLIERHYPHMKRWVAHMSQYLEDGLMPRDTYGDWCVPPEDPSLIHSQDPARKTESTLLASAYFYLDLRLMESFARLLGQEEEAQDFAGQAEALARAFNDEFLDAERGVYGKGTQTGQVLPLYFGMVPEELRQRVFDYLVHHIMVESGGHLATGLIGCQWLMRTLSDNGRPDVAYALATQTAYPSWGYMAEQGATTIWELWNGDTADPAMNSHNHLMLTGDLALWFYEYLAGIRPAAPGFARVAVRPYVVGDLTEVRARTQTVRGLIEVHWRRDGDALEMEVSVPPNVAGDIHVPKLEARRVTVQESGVVCWNGANFVEGPAGLESATDDGRYVRFRVGSGTYRFASTPTS